MGAAETLDDLMRRYGREDFLGLAESAGLQRVGGRIQCPFSGCRDQGPKRNANVSVTQGRDGCWHLRCWRCDARGRYVDLYMAVKGLALTEALEQLRGYAAATPARPQLRVVPPPGSVPDDKMKPDEVQRVWQACAEADEAGVDALHLRAGLAADVRDTPLVARAAAPDADLIAAAAELLEALLRMRDEVREFLPHVCGEALTQAEAAIRKARGETP